MEDPQWNTKSSWPCPRCTFAILAIGVRRIAIGVSQEAFARLLPGEPNALSIREIVRRLELDAPTSLGVEILGPFLEEEGLRAFEHWDGEYRPLEELLENARRAREQRGSGA